VRADLARQAEQEADRRVRDSLVEQLLRPYDFPLPETPVEQRTQERLRELISHLLSSGVSPEVVQQINWKEYQAEERIGAVRDVRQAIVMERIAEAEGVRVTEGEIEAEVAQMAAARREPVEAVRARLTKGGGLASIENRLRSQKALEVVVQSAEITTEELSESQETGPTAHAAQPESQPEDQL
jgi:trigger factor